MKKIYIKETTKDLVEPHRRCDQNIYNILTHNRTDRNNKRKHVTIVNVNFIHI